jgi:hypothetical protein
MKLDEGGLMNFSVGKTFQREKRINFLDFSHDGLRIITSGEDDQMVIYDCEKGTEKQVCGLNLQYTFFRASPISLQLNESDSAGGEVFEVRL